MIYSCFDIFNNNIHDLYHETHLCVKTALNNNKITHDKKFDVNEKFNNCIINNAKKHKKIYVEYQKCLQKPITYNFPIKYGSY
jgi:hypothetical protein